MFSSIPNSYTRLFLTITSGSSNCFWILKKFRLFSLLFCLHNWIFPSEMDGSKFSFSFIFLFPPKLHLQKLMNCTLSSGNYHLTRKTRLPLSALTLLCPFLDLLLECKTLGSHCFPQLDNCGFWVLWASVNPFSLTPQISHSAKILQSIMLICWHYCYHLRSDSFHLDSVCPCLQNAIFLFCLLHSDIKFEMIFWSVFVHGSLSFSFCTVQDLII